MGKSEQTNVGRNSKQKRSWIAALQSALEVSTESQADASTAFSEILVLSASPSGSRFVFEMRFKAGEEYCCGEASCFLPTIDKGWWGRIRASLEGSTGRDPPSMSVTIQTVAETGAMFRVDKQLGLPMRAAGWTHVGASCREKDAK